MSVANLINSPAGGFNQGCWKRKGSEEDKDDIESNVKKAKYSWYYALESESPQPTSSDEDVESIHSVQALETEYVQDTSDTSTTTWVNSSDNGDAVEYEVASLSGDENPFVDDLSSSEPEDISRVDTIEAVTYDSDVGLADDSDDSRSSRDSEISRADYWTCLRCNTSNNTPLFRQCEKCWKLRKNFFPPRPRGKKRRRKLEKNKSGQIHAVEGHELTTLDSGLGSSQGSQLSMAFERNRIQMEGMSNSAQRKEGQTSLTLSQESTDTVDIGLPASQASTVSLSESSMIYPSESNTSLMSLPNSEEHFSVISKNDENRLDETSENNKLITLSQESVGSVATTLSIESRDSNQSDGKRGSDVINDIEISMKNSQLPTDPENNSCNCKNCKNCNSCRICIVGPRNGIFVHGQTTHIYTCYRCAKMVWKTTKQCPICKRKLTNVLPAFYA